MVDDKIDGGELSEAPNAQYTKFLKLIKTYDDVLISEWKPAHVLGYFIKKYESYYDIKYKFKFNTSAPSKCFEIFQVKRLASILSSDPTILKEYIDWVFETKVVKAKRRLTSISFITSESLVYEYKKNILLAPKSNGTIDRTTPLSDKLKDIFKTAGKNISNYGELAFLVHISASSPELQHAFDLAEQEGVNKQLLSKIV